MLFVTLCYIRQHFRKRPRPCPDNQSTVNNIRSCRLRENISGCVGMYIGKIGVKWILGQMNGLYNLLKGGYKITVSMNL